MTIVQRNGTWLSARVGDELVMMSVSSGNYVTISKVGARIWELVEQPRTFDALCDQLVREYEVTPEYCRESVTRFLAELEGHDAITIRHEPPAQDTAAK